MLFGCILLGAIAALEGSCIAVGVILSNKK